MEQRLNRLALANTFGAIDVVLHPLFHFWVFVSPESYEKLMGLFVAGLHLKVTHLDSDPGHVILGTIIEATVFWVFGFVGATVYNFFARHSRTK